MTSLPNLGSVGSLPYLAAVPAVPSIGGAQSTTTAQGSPASVSPGPSFLTGTLAKYVTIGLGLILIIVGLFQFKTVQTVTGAVGKAAATAA